jgi:SpoVK/Ycf46/Vps4 family AAA+-type ATPase
MINTCYNACRQLVPVKVRKTEYAENEIYIHSLYCDNDIQVEKLAGPYNDNIKNVIDDMIENQTSRFLLVSRDINAIEKTALALSGVWLDSDNENYAKPSEYICDEDPNMDNYFAEISFNKKGCIRELQACREKMYRNILITDIDMVAVGDKEDALMSLGDFDKVFVVVSPEQMHTELAARLIFEAGFTRLDVPELQDSYYESLWGFLLENDIYKLEANVDISHINRMLHRKFGNQFSEEIIVKVMDMAINKAALDNRNVVSLSDFSDVLDIGSESAVETLQQSVGQIEFKKLVKEYSALANETKLNPKLKTGYENMIFWGNPGTGKTTSAMRFSQIMAEEGFGNGRLVVAERKDLIGRYMGQTAPKIAENFTSAKGGVLFVDEAGFLLDESDYSREAVREFVRYMELYPDVSVVFALYPDEVPLFMNMDSGLESRIKRMVHFEDYTEKELIGIAEYMFHKQGYRMDAACGDVIAEYVKKQKMVLKKQFGNARTIRKLVDAAIVALSFRHVEEQNKLLLVKAGDIEEGISRLKEIKNDKTEFGF